MSTTGINIHKINELFTSVKLISPIITKLCEQFIMDLPKIGLKLIEHCSIVRSVKDYREDVNFEKNI